MKYTDFFEANKIYWFEYSHSLKTSATVCLCREKEFCRISIPMPPIDEQGLEEILQQSRHRVPCDTSRLICCVCFWFYVFRPKCYLFAVHGKKIRPAKMVHDGWKAPHKGGEKKKQASVGILKDENVSIAMICSRASFCTLSQQCKV